LRFSITVFASVMMSFLSSFLLSAAADGGILGFSRITMMKPIVKTVMMQFCIRVIVLTHDIITGVSVSFFP
jgi:hypothetical protein